MPIDRRRVKCPNPKCDFNQLMPKVPPRIRCGLCGWEFNPKTGEVFAKYGIYHEQEPPTHEDCRHRGEELRREECPTCKGKVQVKIFACEIYGECSLKALKGIKCCVGCGDYHAKTD